jgi:hypothetical protein
VLDVIDIQYGETSYRARLFYAANPGAKQVPFQSVAAVMPIPAGSGSQRRNAGWNELSSGSVRMGKNTPPRKNTPESGCETKPGAHRSPAGTFFGSSIKSGSSHCAAGHRTVFAALAQHLQLSVGVKTDFMVLKTRGNPTKTRSQQ